MKKWILSVIITFAYIYGFGGEIIHVIDNEQQLIGKEVVFYKDITEKKSLSQILELYQQNKFEKNTRAVFAQPANTANFWFAFTVQSNLNTPIWVNVINQGFDFIDFYTFDENLNLLDSMNTGVFVPPSKRIKHSKTFWYNILKGPEQMNRTIFIRIDFAGIMEVPIMIGGEESLRDVEDESEFYAIFFIGGLIIMLLYNTSLWWFTKDNVYGYYSGYILWALLITCHLNNYPLLPSIFGAKFTYNYLFVWFAPASYFISSFMIRYLELKRRAPRMSKIIQWVSGITVLICLSNLFIPPVFLMNVFQVASATLLLICLFVTYRQWKRGFIRAQFYSIGWSCNILSILTYMGVSNGFIPFTAISRNIMYLGVLCELIIFSIALAQRLNELKQKHEILNKRLVKSNSNLSESNESLDSFNYHVSHDLKTVLNNQLVLSRMIVKYLQKEDLQKVQEVATRLIDSGENGVETVRNFLEISKEGFVLSEEGRKGIKVKKEIARILEENGLKGQVSVKIVKEGFKDLKIGAKVLESILLNLFTNSIKYNNNAPEIEMELILENSIKTIIIKDNGIGIDLEKDGASLFKPFNRIQNEKHTEGTGIGLYLIKKLVHSLNGEIEVESKLGKGTSFILKFENL